MLRSLFLLTQVSIIALALYNAAIALFGWKDRVPAPAGVRARRFRIVVPAHNEAGVIGRLLDDLGEQRYPADLIETWVIADRCTDATRATATAASAHVAERRRGPDGKGAALAWYLTNHPLDGDEALVVLDADNRVPPNLLGRFADELDAGHAVLQAYLDVANPGDSPLATASALSYWAGNRMVQLARTNLGWSADLGGTGMCLTAEAVAAVGGFGASLTEDQEIAARLALGGFRPVWLHDVRIHDEKPASLETMVGQRARWAAGKRQVARTYAADLFRRARRDRSFEDFDHALRLVQPGRSFVALLSGLFAIGSAATRSRLLAPWPVWTATTSLQVLLPLPFLHKDGVEWRYLVRYPFLAFLGALWVPIRLLSRRRVAGWYHTPHHDRPAPGSP